MKVVINTCYGRFSVSKAIYDELGVEWDGYGYLDKFDREENEFRSDPKLIAAIEKVGVEAASGPLSELRIVEIPFTSIEGWYISGYDGNEWIAEDHSTWS